jgi:hypothetical protein
MMAWSRSTMDSIRVSEALDSGSIPDETTTKIVIPCNCISYKGFLFRFKHGLNNQG